MPRKKQTPSKPYKHTFKAFLNVTLNKQQKEAVKKNTLTAAKALAAIEEIASDGYEVKISHDPEKGFYQVGVFAKFLPKEHPNGGFYTTIRHPDLQTAVSAFVMWHEDIMQGDWSVSAAPDWDW